MDLELADRVAVVTGASAGIGRGVAEVLAEEGVLLALVARRQHLLEDVARRLVARGYRAPLVVPVDLVDPRAVDVIKASVWEAYGRIDILVNNAGGSRPAWPAASEDVWAEGFGLSFTAVRRLTLAFLPHMLEQRWGRIINITTTQEPLSVNVDQVAKAAQHAWAKGLSREVGQHGVTVNSVAPGRIMSEQIERNYPTAEERQQFAAASIPVGYLGEPHDMGHAVAFLASSRARYITGSIVYVDGGLHRSSF